MASSVQILGSCAGVGRPSLSRRTVVASSGQAARSLRTAQHARHSVFQSLQPAVTRSSLPLRAAAAEPLVQYVDEVDEAVIDKKSYSQQYDELFSQPLITSKAVPKPSKEAQANEPDAVKVFASDVHATKKNNLWFGREWDNTDRTYAIFIGSMHLLCLAAPFTFSWSMVGLFAVGYFITGCLGITLSYHRQLSHRSFQTPKWVEYILAYCGVLAVQGDPIEWASSHRYHHLHTDTPLDPHSPYEGLWFSHAGWLLDHLSVEKRVSDRSNASDLSKQWFYRFIEKTYVWHIVASFALLYAFGGFPAVVWGGALRTVWVYHITWLVNSAAHVWGNQEYNTGDLSRNNWWVGILAFGEGWHNNHHAFEFSARHGLKWYQVDMTWMVINILKFFGLATKIKLPSEAQKARLAFATN